MQRHAGRADRLRENFDRDASPSDYGYQTDTGQAAGTITTTEGALPGEAAFPYLEVLEAVTRMPPIIELTRPEHRLGRSPVQADIAFENDITISRVHATIALEGSDYRLYDEGSTSGTWVNDQTVPEYGYQLMDGDEIRLGAAIMRYRQPS
jgi:pSer/pThr/pTyr-binding forkhead associated (FHA) protein